MLLLTARRLPCLFALICLFFAITPNKAIASTEAIVIFIRDDVYEDYQKFLAGRDVLSIRNFQHKNMRRDVADMVLLQQALALGGFNRQFTYLPGKVNFRNTKMLETGELLLSFDSYWLSDAKEIASMVYISDPVIRRGEYFAGIYTSPNNQKTLKIKSLDDLRELSGVSTPKWQTDWKTMSALPLKKLIREDEWLSQARIVHMGWVDFMLMPFFNSADGSYQLEQIHLQRVPGVAILLDDSRHFVISKVHPSGKAAFDAIQSGMKILRENGQIEKMYREAGFLIDDKVMRILNPSSLPAPELTKSSDDKRS